MKGEKQKITLKSDLSFFAHKSYPMAMALVKALKRFLITVMWYEMSTRIIVL
jgi:hypothetical protein